MGEVRGGEQVRKCEVCGKEAKKLYHCGLDFDMECYQVKRCMSCANDFTTRVFMEMGKEGSGSR